RDGLKGVNDIERLVSRCAAGLANARDLVGLKESLTLLPQIAGLLDNCRAAALAEIRGRLASTAQTQIAAVPTLLAEQKQAYAATVPEIAALIGRAISADPPAGLREGGLIRAGYSAELDALRSASRDGRAWIANLETEER